MEQWNWLGRNTKIKIKIKIKIIDYYINITIANNDKQRQIGLLRPQVDSWCWLNIFQFRHLTRVWMWESNQGGRDICQVFDSREGTHASSFVSLFLVVDGYDSGEMDHSLFVVFALQWMWLSFEACCFPNLFVSQFWFCRQFGGGKFGACDTVCQRVFQSMWSVVLCSMQQISRV